MAGYLSEILKMDVAFRSDAAFESDGESLTPSVVTEVLPRAGVVRIADGREAVAHRLDDEWEIVFVREAESLAAQFFRRSTIIPLVVFWAGCALLGWAISRNLVRPLAALARRLPEIESDDETAPMPGRDRTDEIGHLARTFETTRESLLEERRRREASERLAILGRMATGLAHEIKNPVAAIRLHAQLAEAEDESEREKPLRMIVSESEKIENLVNQWLYLARPASPEMKTQNLADCLNAALDVLGPAAGHANVKIEREIMRELVCEFDAHRMAQVFHNLGINAIHAMPEGGALSVAAESEEGDRIVITFRDDGKGFSAEALERYGEMFFSTKEGGMGIGLTVVSEIVKAHGGTVRVRNDKGAVVEIELQ